VPRFIEIPLLCKEIISTC